MQNKSSVVKNKSILGILSLVIGLLIGIGFPIFEGLTALMHDDGTVSVWVFCTLLIAPIGIILGFIAVFTKGVGLG